SRTALFAVHLDFKEVSGELVARILEGILRGDESSAPLPDSYHIEQAVKRVEESGEVAKERILRIEFALIRALGIRGERKATTLFRSIMSEPQLFIELLCLGYKPNNQQEPKEISETDRTAAENAWHVLHDCSVQPGTDTNGN